jgi:opine dehydrogenase
MALLKKISSDGIPFKNSLETLYAQYSLEKKTLSETIRQSPIHSDPAFQAPAFINTRYLTEDLPFGLTPWSSIGRMWGVATPKVDAVIQIASIMTDVDYFTEGLTVDDLGIKGMSPEDVKALVG